MAVRVDWRGNFTELHAAGKVGFRMATDEVPQLVQDLLAIPPLKELRNSKPLVLYFGNDKDRQEFVDAIKEIKGDMRMVKL